MRALALLALAACGDNYAPAISVCDGTDAVRLAVRFDQPGPFAPGEAMFYDNGASFLFVDGTCAYAVKTGARWGDVGSGVADDANLVDRLELADLPDHAGSYAGDVATAPSLHIAFGGDVLDCSAGC